MAKSKGKPLKYKDAAELEAKIEDYYSWCIENDKPMTYSGLAFFLGFASRQSIWEYSKRDDDISLPIKKAMLRIEQDYEEGLRGKSPTGSIFALKNRGWSDKTESVVHATHTIENMSDKELEAEIAKYDKV